MPTITVNSTSLLVAAIQIAKPGDTILLAPGTYNTVKFGNVHFAGNVTIASADPASPAVITSMNIWSSSGLTFSDLKLHGSGTSPFTIQPGCHNITLTGLHVRGIPGLAVQSQTARGLDIAFGSTVGCSNITISNCRFHDLADGIGVSGDGITIVNNSFVNLGTDGIDGGVISNITIENNYFSDFQPNIGVHPDAMQFSTRGWTSAVPGDSNVTISGNVITRGSGQSTQGIFLSDETGTHPFSNAVITNNLVIGEGYNGIAVHDATGLTMTGNDVVGYSDQDNRILLETVNGATLTGNSAESYVWYPDDTAIVQSGDTTNTVVTDGGAALLTNWLAADPSFSAAIIQAGTSRPATATSGGTTTSGSTTTNATGGTTAATTTGGTTTTKNGTTTAGLTATTTGSSGNALAYALSQFVSSMSTIASPAPLNLISSGPATGPVEPFLSASTQLTPALRA